MSKKTCKEKKIKTDLSWNSEQKLAKEALNNRKCQFLFAPRRVHAMFPATKIRNSLFKIVNYMK